MDIQEFFDKIEMADMVLVGLGEEFNEEKYLKQFSVYTHGLELLQEAGYHWLQPAWNAFCLKKAGNENVRHALDKLAEILKNKNYFVISTSTNSVITEIQWKQDRLVMPCGSAIKKQCAKGCPDIIQNVSAEDQNDLCSIFESIYTGVFPQEGNIKLGNCPDCGTDMIFNNIFAECYNETGYREQWQNYTRWLQGTLNRRLVLLELGAGMRYPSVMRWPFEKIAFFNNKATLIRINEKLYQLTEELKGKGYGIPQNAIEWLKIL